MHAASRVPFRAGFRRATIRRASFRATRRGVLAAGLGAAVAAATAACDGLATEPAGGGQHRRGHPTGSGGKEAPALREQAEAGQLPPLRERLPSSPLVVQPTDQPGRYGSSWRDAMLGAGEFGAVLVRTIGYDSLVRWDPSWRRVVPNLAVAVESSAGGREYTIRLRPGLRWSDGTPFTADDIAFAYNDVLGSADLFPEGPPAAYTTVSGEPAKLTKVDDTTIRLRFARPKGLFLEQLAAPNGNDLTIYPRHYLRRFHASYAEGAAERAKKAGLDSWATRFLQQADPGANPDLPTLFGWVPTSVLGSSSRLTAERNPYYWKVDPDGRQLPYLDEVTYAVIDDVEVMLLKATNGELDFHVRHFNTLRNKPVLARERDAGGYRFVDTVPSYMNQMLLLLNLTHDDPAMRAVFGDKRFRVALSHAIDRRELIAGAFQRQGVPWQAAPRKESDYYDEEFATQYTAHDVAKANRILDDAGYGRRDDDGFRLRPDGRRIAFTIEVASPTLTDEWVPALELVREHWKRVGVDARIKSEDRTLWGERLRANKTDAAVWIGEGGLSDAVLRGFAYLPLGGAQFAKRWSDWYVSRGAEGEEPPAAPRRQLQLYDQLQETPDAEARDRLFREILRIAKEQFYVIGTVQLTQGYGVARRDFHNVPTSMPDAYLYPTPAPTRPEQYFRQSP